jgi:hypothetical protein
VFLSKLTHWLLELNEYKKCYCVLSGCTSCVYMYLFYRCTCFGFFLKCNWCGMWSLVMWSSFIPLFGGSRAEFIFTEATTGLLHQPRMKMDDYKSGAIGGMIGRRNRSSRRKPAPVPLCSPQISHDPTRARTPAAAMGSRRLTVRRFIVYVPCLGQKCCVVCGGRGQGLFLPNLFNSLSTVMQSFSVYAISPSCGSIAAHP